MILALKIAREMMEAGQEGSIVTLLCDSGERYLDTYYDADWVRENFEDLTPYKDVLSRWE